MNVLVLGGNGFIGSHVVDVLLMAGHSVRVFDRSPEKFRSPLPNVDYRLGAFEDSFLLAEALQGIDVVCHLISTTVPGTSNLDPVADIQSNLINTVRLLDQMRIMGVQKIIYLSSGGTVYGNPESVPIGEDQALNPICSYGVVKVAIEKYLFMYQQCYDLKPIVLRAANPYGPRQGHKGVQGLISTFLSKAINHDVLEVWGDGSVVRDYIYIEDLAQLCLAALDSEVTGVFNAGTGKGDSINEIIKAVDLVTGSTSCIKYKQGRSYDVLRVTLDTRKACEQFNWSPKVSLEEGVKLHFDWLKSIIQGNEV